MSELLSLRNISYSESSIDYLKNISFSIERGENAVLFGPESSGLHLLCPLIIGFKKATSGEIFFNDEATGGFDYVESVNFKKQLGYLHSSYGLISNMTAEENISLPLQYHSQMSAAEIKKYVASLIDSLSLESCKSFRPVDLTSSEMLRTAYARSTVLDPDLLLVEHAFEGQSPMNLISFIDVLTERSSRRDCSIIFITYEPRKFLSVADKFLMFYNGRIVFSGNPEEFRNSDNPYLIQYEQLSADGPMIIL